LTGDAMAAKDDPSIVEAYMGGVAA